MSSRVPRTIGATSSSTAPSSGRAAREQLRRGRVHGAGVAEPEPHEPAFGLVRDRVAAQLHDDRVADRVGGRDRGVGVGGGALVEHGDAVLREELLRRGFGEGGHGDGRSDRRAPVLPVLVAQHPLEQLAGVGARQLGADLVRARAACSSRGAARRTRAARRGRWSPPPWPARSRARARPTRRRGCRTPRRRAPAGARGARPRSRRDRC